MALAWVLSSEVRFRSREESRLGRGYHANESDGVGAELRSKRSERLLDE